MQSGISASQELQTAFRTLVSDPSQRALLATISSESLNPLTTLPTTRQDSFTADLAQLQPHLKPNQALYVLLKLDSSAPDGYAAITYVPNAAPVREKMLFASTRLTLVRELGIERFRQTVFATEAAELTAEGWARHVASEEVAAPLTAEESGLRGVKEAEAAESQGTGARRGHVSARVNVKTGESVLEALRCLLEEGCRGTLVQLKYTLPGEELTLDSCTDSVALQDLAATITPDEPRYSFYSHPTVGGAAEETPRILFIYTCPSSSKIKERMIYSTGKSWTRTVAERDAGIVIAKSLEATEPSELTVEVLGGADGGEAGMKGEQESKPAAAAGFARPKRPGRR